MGILPFAEAKDMAWPPKGVVEPLKGMVGPLKGVDKPPARGVAKPLGVWLGSWGAERGVYVSALGTAGWGEWVHPHPPNLAPQAHCMPPT